MRISFYPFIVDEVYQSLLPIKWFLMSQKTSLLNVLNKLFLKCRNKCIYNVAKNGFLMPQ